MKQELYINRKVYSDEETLTEAELLQNPKSIIILAEPGAGKTSLLKSLARQLSVKEVTANYLCYAENKETGLPLVIDAFDELARIDQAGINKLLASALKTRPSKIIISSRSSEWDNSATYMFEEFTGCKPQIVRLLEFNESEQEKIYEDYTSRSDFLEFKKEVSRFSLQPLLSNPQFLKLFSDAYIESDGYFSDRSSIFSQAVLHLTKESNKTIKTTQKVSIENKIRWASEVFTSLLLSGAEGVTTNESVETRSFPFLNSFINEQNQELTAILATKLFKPDSSPTMHRPVHKIVAEYCSAKYLTERVDDSSDDLTIELCLSIIAPNNCVRDELRGLLGWMAALGNNQIQLDIIKLDAYSVIANGDPSQLNLSAKRLLLSELKEVESNDPYFRRNDFSRRFSVAGFFTANIIADVKMILTSPGESELRDLLLNLLVDSEASHWFEKELSVIATSTKDNKRTRLLANDCLMDIESYDYLSDFTSLVSEASYASLNVAAEIIKQYSPANFELETLESYFRACATLYVSDKASTSSSVMERYFLKLTYSEFDLLTTELLLDALSTELSCSCGKKYYECVCRNGISKIIGSFLDHYFTIATPPYDSLKIWQWIRNLNFATSGNTKNMVSVSLLRENSDLRQQLLVYHFSEMNNSEDFNKFNGYEARYSHAGLIMTPEDYVFVADFAFRQKNIELWTNFLPYHWPRDREDLGPNPLRSHMRKQANACKMFMKAWALSHKRRRTQLEKVERVRNSKYERTRKREKRKKLKKDLNNHKFVQENKEEIRLGSHFNYLYRFAYLTLDHPEEIVRDFGDEHLVRYVLKNCQGFIEAKLPTLLRLAELRCTSQYLKLETILLASCIEIFRENGSLDSVKPSLLIVLRTNLTISYSAVDESEKERLKAEVDRLIFPSNSMAEKFLRDYLEPQVLNLQCINAKISLLKYDKVFEPLISKLVREWLSKAEQLHFNSQSELFELAAKHIEHEEIIDIIKTNSARCLVPSPALAKQENFEQQCKFWFVRAFYFLSLDNARSFWDKLKTVRNNIFLFVNVSSHWNRMDHENWPSLSSVKVEAILNAFFVRWPKVPLPSHYGTGSPQGEVAYRFLTEICWLIRSDSTREAIPVLKRLLNSYQLTDIHQSLKGILAEVLKKHALKDFQPPTPRQVRDLLDRNAVVSVEGLRSLIIQELTNYQKDISGGEFNSAKRFYSKLTKGQLQRLGEVESTEIIAEQLASRVKSKGVVIVPEHQTKNQNRIDITATKVIDDKKKLLVVEAKGQWHKDLYTAASTQLHKRYSIHPNAEHQGIYLVIWFGTQEKVANKINHGIKNPTDLKNSIIEKLPSELKGLIDIFVLDVSISK